jgi:CubicO group peptidase (beta-lactamase class C family)
MLLWLLALVGLGHFKCVCHAADYGPVIDALRPLIRDQMQDKGLAALSIALVDDQQIVWSEGFGFADPSEKIPATADSVYRVGSVSKLFTDLAVMRLVQRGELDLDAPVTEYLPDFRPRNPFGETITLRMLMSHRAGLVREPPVGNYFADDEPSLAETVRSLNDTELVYRPGSKTKYSNAGIGVVGYVLERTQQEPFVPYLQRVLLRPLGMERSAFEPKAEWARDQATGFMWTYDGRVFEAPQFQLGMSPAGSMYSSVNDLGRFMSFLFEHDREEGDELLATRTVASMWEPQFVGAGASQGFGLGFYVGQFEGQRRVGHGGAVYGFATTLQALPDAKLGVVVVATKDFANSVVNRIGETALRWLLAVRDEQPLTPFETTAPVPTDLIQRLPGTYRHGSRVLELTSVGEELFLAGTISEYRQRLRMQGEALIVDDALGYGFRLVPQRERLLAMDAMFERQDRGPAPPIPARWQGLVGDYGWDHNVLQIRVNADGRPEAVIEWFAVYPLEEVSDNVFNFPNRGLYDGEQLIFTRDEDGRATRVKAASVDFLRRE